MNSGATAPEWIDNPQIGDGITIDTSTYSKATEYQNTTGRTIEVYAEAFGTTAGQTVIAARGPTSGALNTLQRQTANGNSTYLSVFILVPPGDYWQIDGPGTPTISVY